MPMYVAAHGEVVAGPTEITTDDGTATVMLLKETQPHGPEAEYEVCCAQLPLGRRIREQIRIGDRLVVLGTLQLHALAVPIEDKASAARITLNAAIISVDLEATRATDPTRSEQKEGPDR